MAANSLTRLGGGDERALELVPSAVASFRQMAATMIFTSSMATVSMAYALEDAVQAPLFFALVLGCFWGIGIMVLDRTLMLIGMGTSTVGSLTMAGTRLLAAMLIGMVVSTPLTLKIFESDINAELVQIQLAQGKSDKDEVLKSPEKQRLDKATADLAAWQSIASGTLPASFATTDSAASTTLLERVTRLEGQVEEAREVADQAAMLYNCERYGATPAERALLDDPSKCAKVPGPNGNAAEYLRRSEEASRALATLEGKLADARQAVTDAEGAVQQAADTKLEALQAQAPTQIAELEKEHKRAQSAYDKLVKKLGDANINNDGLLAQLTALWQVGEERKGLLVAHLLLAALFVLIEFMPVLAKLMWQFGPTGRDYEGAAASLRATGVADGEIQRNQAQLKAETEYEVGLVKLEAEVEAQRQAAQHQRDLERIRHEGERAVEQARVDEFTAQQRTINSDFTARREAVLRERAEVDHNAWEHTVRPETVTLVDLEVAAESTGRRGWRGRRGRRSRAPLAS